MRRGCLDVPVYVYVDVYVYVGANGAYPSASLRFR
jgi:hypothetical protein